MSTFIRGQLSLGMFTSTMLTLKFLGYSEIDLPKSLLGEATANTWIGGVFAIGVACLGTYLVWKAADFIVNQEVQRVICQNQSSSEISKITPTS